VRGGAGSGRGTEAFSTTAPPLLLLLLQALSKASAAQRALLKANYGRHEEEAIATVKALYRELGLEAAFAAYEQASYDSLVRQIAEATATGPIPADVYLSLLHKIYKRSK
jgi:farnesyl diphosphate synthase